MGAGGILYFGGFDVTLGVVNRMRIGECKGVLLVLQKFLNISAEDGLKTTCYQSSPNY